MLCQQSRQDNGDKYYSSLLGLKVPRQFIWPKKGTGLLEFYVRGI